MPKLPPNTDADLVPAIYKEGEGFSQRSSLNDQDHEQSGGLSPSSDPVKDDSPIKIHYPG